MFQSMIKLVSLVIFLAISSGSFAQQQPSRPMQECASMMPYGFPGIERQNTTPICRTAYALLHDDDARVAIWVAYTLLAQNTLGCEPRVNAFSPDQSIARGRRAELVDYAGSGFDTGHIANNADMSWDPMVARESFILSNMAPQIPALNRGSWRQLETAVRAWAFSSGGSLTIYSGSIYGSDARRIGPNGVVVPSAFYKIIVNNTTRQHLAFLFPHQDLQDFRMAQSTIAEIESATGVRFPVPGDREARNPIWHIDLANLAAARRARCRG